MQEQNSAPCKSIFEGGKKETTREQFTQIWITLINQIEKSREIVVNAC